MILKQPLPPNKHATVGLKSLFPVKKSETLKNLETPWEYFTRLDLLFLSSWKVCCVRGEISADKVVCSF